MTEHIVVDCRGMQCPAPILEIAKTARRVASAPAMLEILADDDDFPTDLEAWCRSAQAELRGIERAPDCHRALVALNGASDESVWADASGPVSNGTGVRAASMTSPRPMIDLTTVSRTDHRAAQGARRPPAPHAPSAMQSMHGPPVRGSSAAAQSMHGQPPAAPPSSGASLHGPAPQAPASHDQAPQAPAAAQGSGRVPAAPAPSLLDLNGLRAPHPIMRLSQVLLQQPGATVVVRCDDPGFMTDLVVWAGSASVRVLALEQRQDGAVARLQLPPAVRDNAPLPSQTLDVPSADVPIVDAMELAARAPQTAASPVVAQANRCTLLVLRNDFESLMAAMLTANAARAQNMDVVIYFSFWGVNLLRGERARRDMPREPVSFLQRLMKWLMPKGPRRQKMSKMHMGGAGRGMMELFMRRNNVMSLTDLIEQAVETDIRFMVCTMSMGIMGIQKRDLMDLPNIEYGGVTAFVDAARDSRMSMVF